MDLDTTDTQSPRLREAGRGLLSLALMDARNRSLALFAACEDSAAAEGPEGPDPPLPAVEDIRADTDPPLWLLGHAGWFQEYWIARNVQRQRGERCDPRATRLPSVETLADAWYDPRGTARGARWQLPLPGAEATRQYLLSTLETTLELLEGVPEDGPAADDALYFYRLALFHEDRCGEALAECAQTLGTGAQALRSLLPPAPARAAREPLLFPATRWMLGQPTGPGPRGLVFDLEKWAHAVAVPEFEIDAQAVSWGQYGEFVEDGGYDEPGWWSPAGREWLQARGRRVPRHVEQMRQGVLAWRFGELRRVAPPSPVLHVCVHEAEAWCRWAGRRLPTEVEWEIAAASGSSRGFRWGEAWEWTATPFRPYPGFTSGPASIGLAQRFGTHRAVRGGSFATAARLRHPKARHDLAPGHDTGFVGFRSCAV